MAEEVPVSDVLCDAMEYLCKLGSNLQSRSKNLKDKKINKSKLRNSHAIHKAANKVLMICQLSKKSLENVEIGVKKVLSVVDASQATICGGNTSQPRNCSYRYFNFGSDMLKVANSVPLKHYMSVKVKAVKMPAIIQDQYPVYYNCKLYRLRRKRYEQKPPSGKENENHESLDNSDMDMSRPEMKADSLPTDDKENKISPDRNEFNIVDSCLDAEDRTIKQANTYNENIDSSITNNLSKSSKSNELVLSSDNEDKEHKKMSNKHNKKGESLSDDECTNKQYGDNLEKNEINLKSITSECALNVNQTFEESRESESNLLEKINKRDSESFITDLNSVLEQKEITQSTKTTEDSVQKFSNKDAKLLDNLSVSKEKHLEDTENNLEQGKESQEPQKPLIKCVNINKLLKPHVINVIEDSPPKIDKKYCRKYERSRIKNKPIRKESGLQKNTEDDNWKSKRKEVLAFKPKNFAINVTRLPKITPQFLKEHNLNKITQNGLVVCVGDELAEDNSCMANHNKQRIEITSNINSSLSSDSNRVRLDNNGDCTNTTPIDTAQIKSYLLFESDSENEGKQDISKKIVSDKDSVTHLKENESTLNPKESSISECSPEDQNNPKLNSESLNTTEDVNINSNFSNKEQLSKKSDQINSSLLDDSSDNSIKMSRNNNRYKIKRSKSKKDSKIMDAKKKLLSCSSSSDGDDEQSKKAINKIKRPLLKTVSSSDDDKSIKSNKKQASSESDHEIMTQAKRRRIKPLRPSQETHEEDDNTEESNKKKHGSTAESLEDAEEHSNSSSIKVRS